MFRWTFLFISFSLLILYSNVTAEGVEYPSGKNTTLSPPEISCQKPNQLLPQDGTIPAHFSCIRDELDSGPRIAVFPVTIVVDSSCEQAINIANEGDELLSWDTEKEADWISCDPERGELRPNEDTELFLFLNGEDLNRGIHEERLHILSNATNNHHVVIIVIFRKDCSQPPRWIEVPHRVTVYAMEYIEFMVRGINKKREKKKHEILWSKKEKISARLIESDKKLLYITNGKTQFP